MARAVKIAISLDRLQLDRIDRAAKRHRMSRSRLIRSAVAAVLKAEEERLMREKIDRVFADSAVLAEQKEVAEQFSAHFLKGLEKDEW